jgi:DNA-binding Lrp family transcriptional regulator
MRLSRRALELLNFLKWCTRKFSRVYPLQQQLADRLHVTVRQVKRLIKELRDLGIVKTFRCGRSAQEYELDQHHPEVKNVPSKSPRSPLDVPSMSPPEAPHHIIETKDVSEEEKARPKPPRSAPSNVRIPKRVMSGCHWVEVTPEILADEGLCGFYHLPYRGASS